MTLKEFVGRIAELENSKKKKDVKFHLHIIPKEEVKVEITRDKLELEEYNKYLNYKVDDWWLSGGWSMVINLKEKDKSAKRK